MQSPLFAQEFRVIDINTSQCSSGDSFKDYGNEILKSKRLIAGDTTIYQILKYTNCGFNKVLDVKTSGDSIFLIYGPNIYYEHWDEENEYSIEVDLCHCIYNFNYVLLNVNEPSKVFFRMEMGGDLKYDQPVAFKD